MIFALATDENTLFVFSSPEEAIAYCEGVDVAADGWLFWDERGAALQPEFLTPNHQGHYTVGSGTYRLIPARSRSSLDESLGGVHSIETNPFLASLPAVRAHLAVASSLSGHGA